MNKENTAHAHIPPEAVIEPGDTLSCQVAVIGSGPGGAITAALLAEAGRDVLLIEEGALLARDSHTAYSPAEMAAKYRGGGVTAALGKPSVAYAEGSVVGGGSEVNAGLYHRTPPEVLESWRRDYWVDALSNEEMEPHFAACEQALSVGANPHAMPGPARLLRDGAEAVGWSWLEAPRWFRYGAEGDSSRGSGESYEGERQSMSATFVPRALQAGARLLPGVRIARLRRSAGAWLLTGEASSEAGGESGGEDHGKRRESQREVTVRAESVFVACGAIHTPALLRRSGWKRNVGNTLAMHPTVKLAATFAEPVTSPGMAMPAVQVKHFAPRYSFGCSVATRATLALALADHPQSLHEVGEHWRNSAVFYAMTSSRPAGTVRHVPGFRDPLVRYKLDDAELSNLGEGLHNLGRLLLAAGAQQLYAGVAGIPAIQDEAGLTALPASLPRRGTSLMTIHLFSSCPMGEDKRRCAVDSFGRMRGAEGLRVADASLLCTAPGVNPQGSVMAIAHRNALHYLGEL